MGKYASYRAELRLDGAMRRPAIGRLEIAARREEVGQIAAISAFEGLRPTPEYEHLRDSYASGEISARTFKERVLGRWKRNG
ncbi:antitoxin VbhA family protein [Arenibaculum sp.]|uniref:antitoxin VbhA family protein n=1 Tax=Arenibaculum sp. TaxID=2865862 RepID=UPI002E0DC258|nr:antitoxin VbhA family protein [Arenibaculum sp.]